MAEAMEDASLRSALVSSTPRDARAWALGLEGSRVTARRANSDESFVEDRITEMTLPPWLPVAPKIVRSFLVDIIGCCTV